jgi:hypothetical protein
MAAKQQLISISAKSVRTTCVKRVQSKCAWIVRMFSAKAAGLIMAEKKVLNAQYDAVHV